MLYCAGSLMTYFDLTGLRSNYMVCCTRVVSQETLLLILIIYVPAAAITAQIRVCEYNTYGACFSTP